MEDALALVTQTYGDEACPQLLGLQFEAQQRAVPYLWDDDYLSIGYGRHSQTWPRNALPSVDDVPWSQLGDICHFDHRNQWKDNRSSFSSHRTASRSERV